MEFTAARVLLGVAGLAGVVGLVGIFARLTVLFLVAMLVALAVFFVGQFLASRRVGWLPSGRVWLIVPAVIVVGTLLGLAGGQRGGDLVFGALFWFFVAVPATIGIARERGLTQVTRPAASTTRQAAPKPRPGQKRS